RHARSDDRRQARRRRPARGVDPAPARAVSRDGESACRGGGL
ncbi:MAG: D-alanine aminotransferase, partial [uncultured Microvirga sp.]